MRVLAILLIVMTAPAYTQTIPAAPGLSAGAEFKGLRFDWTSVPGASWYQFEYRAHQTGPFVQQGAIYPASATYTRMRLPLHMFDWTYARYRVAACNVSGCARSNEVSVSGLRREAVGYFKANPSASGLRFGADTALSPDGLNFAVAAPADFTTPYGSTQQNNAVYVFRRASNGTWTQRARLTPATPSQVDDANYNVMNVAISADGNTVVLGMPYYFHKEDDEQSGEVFVFRFNGASWVRSRLYSGNRGYFGRWVGINDAGDTIATPYGENFYPDASRRVAIYKLIDGAWQPVRGINDRAGQREFCSGGVLSRDGSTVAETCEQESPAILNRPVYVRTFSGPNWTVRQDIPLAIDYPGDHEYQHAGLAISANGDTVVAQIAVYCCQLEDAGSSEVQVFKRSSGAYSRTATLTPGAWRQPDMKRAYGQNIAVSGDGGTIAVGDSHDNGWGNGPRAAPLNPDAAQTGAVYVYRLKSNWVLANMIKPNRNDNLQSFGTELSLNDNGQTLIIGYPADCSSATGIGGDWSSCDNNGKTSGAVYLY